MLQSMVTQIQETVKVTILLINYFIKLKPKSVYQHCYQVKAAGGCAKNVQHQISYSKTQ